MEYSKIYSEIKNVIDDLQDEESKKLFMYLLCYNLTNDKKYICEFDDYRQSIYSFVKTHRTLEDILSDGCADKGAILYGAGRDSNIVLPIVIDMGITVKSFCDRDELKQKHLHMEFPVISPEKLLTECSDHPVIVATSLNARDVYFELVEKGFPEQNIYFPSDRIELFQYFLEGHEQYFGEDFFKANDDEIFLDAGSYDGDTISSFYRFCGGKYNRIIGFEPDSKNYDRLKKNTSNLPNIELHNKGVWNRNEVLRFDEKRTDSRITDGGIITIETVSIDEVLRGAKVTLIKMDIEGAELKALEGAQTTIKKHKPRLAICVYHKPEDIFEIPVYIKRLVPEYRFWIRRYGPPGSFGETVLYAVAD